MRRWIRLISVLKILIDRMRCSIAYTGKFAVLKKVGMIATLFGRKKISEEKLANAVVNAVLEMTDQGYPTIVEELVDAPEFVARPVFGPGDDELFALIVLAGNLLDAPKHLPAGQDRRFVSHCDQQVRARPWAAARASWSWRWWPCSTSWSA